jgi:hypothetical protein
MSLESLTIYQCLFPKKRIGKPNDGGYVIVDLPSITMQSANSSTSSGVPVIERHYDGFISGGISNDISFEDALLDYYPDLGACLAFDGTVNSIPRARNAGKIQFIKKNLGAINSSEITNLEEYIRPLDNIFLKIDIEGHEYALFKSIVENGLMSKIRQIVLEIHTPADIRAHPNYYTNLAAYGVSDNVLLDFLELIKKTHTIMHLHPNNGCATHIQEGGVIIPNVFEITLIRNDILEEIGYTWPVNTTRIPSVIDMPNIPNKNDIKIDYSPFCKKINIARNINQSITLITCYYKVKSKHTFNEYALWIQNLLLSITCNIIIYTSADQVEWIKYLIQSNNNLEISSSSSPSTTNTTNDTNANTNTSNTSVGRVKIIVKELQDLEIVRKYPGIWETQYMKDPTRDIRTKECYMIWNSKLSLVKEAITLNPFQSDKFVWNDIGSLRTSRFVYENYMDFIQYPRYENISKNKIDIVSIKGFYHPNQRIFQNETHLSGALFGGGTDAFLRLIELFYKNFDMYLENGYFIGCDQQILATCYQLEPDLFNLITPDYSNKIIDKWFYLYYYYSQEQLGCNSQNNS